jgi:hypothetical protein
MKYFLSFLLLVFYATGCSHDDGDDGGTYEPTGVAVRDPNVLGPGVRMTYGYVHEYVSYDVDSAGENRRWNFTNCDWSGYFALTYVDPCGCPFSSHFPSATRGVEVIYSDEPGYILSVFEKVDQTGIWDLGLSDADDYYVLDEPDCRLQLPCRYGTQWTEVERDSSGDQYYWSVYLDSVAYTCDAWGYLVTPFDSCWVLRGTERWVEYSWNSYDTIPRCYGAGVDYYWIDEHGDVVVWTSSDSLGYINMRTATEEVPPAASAPPAGSGRALRQNDHQDSPRERRTFTAAQIPR